jgi:hypothetical protein
MHLNALKTFLKFSSVYTPDPSNKGRRRIFVEREGRGGWVKKRRKQRDRKERKREVGNWEGIGMERERREQEKQRERRKRTKVGQYWGGYCDPRENLARRLKPTAPVVIFQEK